MVHTWIPILTGAGSEFIPNSHLEPVPYQALFWILISFNEVMSLIRHHHEYTPVGYYPTGAMIIIVLVTVTKRLGLKFNAEFFFCSL